MPRKGRRRKFRKDRKFNKVEKGKEYNKDRKVR